jgi:hypothetical protein
MSFLDEAAALLRKSAATNEQRNGRDDFRRDLLMEGRERIAMKFAQLAAIENGLIPVELVGELLTQMVHAGHDEKET